MEPRRPKLPHGADIWDLATWYARAQDLAEKRLADAVYVWARVFVWVAAYAYSWLWIGLGAEEAGKVFRRDDLQEALRAQVRRLVTEVGYV